MKEQSKRQRFLGPESDQILAGLRVAIVGLGGGGSHIAQQLAHIGVGHYTLVDPDRIEASNLNRLVGATAADVDSSARKTMIATRQIAGVLPSAQIIQIDQQWQLAAEELRECDIVFGCLDSFGERRQLETAARRYIVPYIDIGMDVTNQRGCYRIVGQVALSMPGRPCLTCMGVVRDSDIADEAQRYGAAGGKPQVVWPNGILASMAVGLAMQLVVPWHDNHIEYTLIEYDGNNNMMAPSTLLSELSATCPHFAAVTSLGDPWFSLPLESAN